MVTCQRNIIRKLKILLVVTLGLVLRQPICVVCGLVCDDAILEPVTVPLNPATPESQFLYFVFVYITRYMGSFSFQYIPLLVSFHLRLGSNTRFVNYHLNLSQFLFFSLMNINLGAYFLSLTFFDKINFNFFLSLK